MSIVGMTSFKHTKKSPHFAGQLADHQRQQYNDDDDGKGEKDFSEIKFEKLMISSLAQQYFANFSLILHRHGTRYKKIL